MTLETVLDERATGFGGAPFGVLLLQLGGPTDADSVTDYLSRFYSDQKQVPLRGGRMLRSSIAKLLTLYHSPRIRKNYTQMGGQSPLLFYMKKQAAGVEKRLRLRGKDAYVVFATRYLSPTIAEALQALRTQGLRRIVVVTLHPQYSSMTTGTILGELNRVVQAQETRYQMMLIDRWHNESSYLDLLALHVQEGIDGFSQSTQGQVHLLFCAECGTQMAPRDQGSSVDPYVDDLQATVHGVMGRLNQPTPYRIALHRSWSPMSAASPSMESAVDDLARQGVQSLLCVPLSFVTDQLETLYEIDLSVRDRATKNGIVDCRRVAALNDDPRFLDVLSVMIERRLAR